ncbi:carboxypeptidase-like regulatory domain-containing protein [Pelomonas sp. KK5]|uniref:carboxypeptidase-like regulatory domain-containing protein n=1 Tax=Pelomonas sp. KK5 TaxID=1855730 RepID=UPI00097C9C4E|nr:carboxypeptidase-like regulatory domain-containing protein [Pelomonas sp. KK5]
MKKRKTTRQLFSIAALLSLAGCLGGGAEPVTGTAAVGAALDGASVELRDALGGRHAATSDAQGRFTLDEVPAGPVMVRCTANAQRLHGLLLNGRIVNCTPLTELALWKLLGRAPAGVFDGFSEADAKGLDAGAVAAAEAAVLAALRDGAGVDIDPSAVPVQWAQTRLVAGSAQDAHDLALDALGLQVKGQAALDLMGDVSRRGLCAVDESCS